MRFGFPLFPRDVAIVSQIAQLAEQLGFDMMGLGDGPAIVYDPTACITLAALQTSRLRLGPCVTNPRTRHPLILANETATIGQIAPGRSFLGIGSGNSGVRGAGSRPASLGMVGRTATTVRCLLSGETVDFNGTPVKLGIPANPVPIMIACTGAHGLQVAGQVADQALMAVGASAEALGYAKSAVQRAAQEAGRDPAKIDYWAYVDTAVADNQAQARDMATSAAVARANILYRGPAIQQLESPLREQIQAMIDRYDYSAHLKPGRTTNYYLAHELGLVDVLLERFAIAGTPSDCRAQVEAIRASGIENVCFNLGTADDLPTALRLLGEHVVQPLA